MSVVNHETAAAPAISTGMSAPHERETLRLLILDDDEVDRRAVRRCLLASGLDAILEETSSASEMVSRLEATRPDCLLLDYHIPGVNATELLRRTHDIDDSLPVVMMTGRGDQELAVELMKAGAADYLPKGALTPERLGSSIRHALELSRSLTARRRAEEDLRTQEAHFRTLANAIPQLAWISDGEGRRSWCNDRCYEFSGLTFDELRDFGWQRLHHPDHLSRVLAGLLAAFHRGEVWEDTYPLRRHDGVYRWFLSRAVPIRDANGRIVRWLGTNTDITQRKEAEVERELLLALEQESRTRAERAIKLRDEILAIVAHDLRDPVHTIAMAASNMLEIPLAQDQRVKQLVVMRRAAKRMDRLISDLLDVSRLELGRFAIRRAPVPLSTLFDEALEAAEVLATPGGVALATDYEGDVPPVMGDRDRLAQVLSNLIGNAIKFTPPTGTVVLRARRAESGVQLSVVDSGQGMPPDELPYIFDRFWQAERASRTGAGLGLAIAKGIIEAHGGRVWAESTLGSGTTVHFTLPCAGEAPASAG